MHLGGGGHWCGAALPRPTADANTNHQSIQCLYGRLLQQVSDDAADLEKFIEICGLLDISIGAKSGRVLNVLCRVRRAEYSNGHLLAYGTYSYSLEDFASTRFGEIQIQKNKLRTYGSPGLHFFDIAHGLIAVGHDDNAQVNPMIFDRLPNQRYISGIVLDDKDASCSCQRIRLRVS
jgi:hypothetical protein